MIQGTNKLSWKHIIKGKKRKTERSSYNLEFGEESFYIAVLGK